MHDVYIGFDNGVTGTIGIIEKTQTTFIKVPVKSEQSYTKKKQNITRIDHEKLWSILLKFERVNAICIIERPMINLGRFKATVSALRALEATLIIIERLSLPIQYIDSKEWQKVMLPRGCKKEELKKVSLDIGCRLFPEHKKLIIKHKDADGLLMAEWAKRKNL